jgi:hypothetical protein
MGSKIKTNTSIIVGGFNNVVPAGVVVEAGTPEQEAEFNALVAAGMAKKTNEAVTDEAKWPTTVSASGNVGAPVSGIVPKAADALDGILDGTVDDVKGRLSGLDADSLARLGEMEAAGKDRVGVHTAIEAATAALAPPAE